MRYAQIRKMDISNGSGIGVSLFVQGCHFHCKDCFNQETWDFNGGQEFTEEIKNTFINLIDKEYVERISILGGEPLTLQNETEVVGLIKIIKQKYPNKKIWLYTGYLYEEIQNHEVLNYIDYLVDGRFETDKKDFNLHYKGSSNQRVIDVPATLKSDNKVIYIFK